MNPQLVEDEPPEAAKTLRPSSKIVGLFRLLAVLTFLVSFFLPAIQLGESGSTVRESPTVGWVCAEFATVMAVAAPLTAIREHAGLDARAFLFPMSGLVNPLVIVYLILCIWRRFVRARLVVAAAIMTCFGATWLLFAKTQTVPLIGHFLWVAGAVALFIPDIVRLASNKDETSAAPPSS